MYNFNLHIVRVFLLNTIRRTMKLNIGYSTLLKYRLRDLAKIYIADEYNVTPDIILEKNRIYLLYCYKNLVIIGVLLKLYLHLKLNPSHSHNSLLYSFF